jgi:hypothetical protein
MTEQEEGAAQAAPLYIKAEGKRGRGASLLTIRIYEAVLDAGDEGLTIPEIHAAVDSSGFRTDTAKWMESQGMVKPTSDHALASDIQSAGERRVRTRVESMRIARQLRSKVHGKAGRRAVYVAGEPPKGYRRKWVRQDPHGWMPVDVKAARRESDEQRDRIEVLQAAHAELARVKRHTRAHKLLAEAVRLLEAR